MDTKFICKRCLYETNAFKDLVRHYNKKYKCPKKLKSYDYSDDQLLVLSLMPYHDNKHTITDNEIEHLKSSNILYENLDSFLDTINNVYKKKEKKCNLCDMSFCKITNLKKHITINCYHQYLIDKNKNIECNNNNNDLNEIIYNNDYINDDINEELLNIKSEESNIENILNNSNITNNKLPNIINNKIVGNNNNITNINQQNIYVEIKHPINFDESWDISDIDLKTKFFIVFNNLMYTSLLEEILKNDINLNVIIDKDSNSSIVYKNDIEKYIEMKSKDIVNITMEKLKDQLLDINNDLSDKVYKDVTDYYRKMITKKYIDYTKDKEIQTKVIDCVSNIFDKNKEKSIEISKNFGY